MSGEAEKAGESSRKTLRFDGSFLEDSRATLYTEATARAIFADVTLDEGDTILDVGSGSGFFVDLLLRSGEHPPVDVIRVDPDPVLLNQGARGRAIACSGEAIPLADGAVDLALCHFVLSRIPVDTAGRVVDEVLRVLRPGGVFLAMEPCLSLTSYKSKADPTLGPLAALGRSMKAQFQSRERDIDEDYGLRLPSTLDSLFQTVLVDLHLARWYTPFPDSWEPYSWAIWRRRVRDLQTRDAVSDFLDAHGTGITLSVDEAPGLVTDTHGTPRLTEYGLQELNRRRLVDLEEAAAGGDWSYVELIPVVRAIGRKT